MWKLMMPDAKKEYLPTRKHPYKGRLDGYTLATSCQRKVVKNGE